MTQPTLHSVTETLGAIFAGHITPGAILLSAASQNNLQVARAVLTSYPLAIHALDSFGNTALHRACSLEMVELLSSAADLVHHQNNKGQTALVHLLRDDTPLPRLDFVPVIRDLVRCGAEPDTMVSGSSSLLNFFAQKNFVPEFLALHEAGGLREKLCDAGYNEEANEFLRLFVMRKNAKVVAALCNTALPQSRRANPNCMVKNNVCTLPVFLAVNFNAAEVIQPLVSAGAELEVFDNRNKTPLVWAVLKKSRRTVEALVFAGARVTEALATANQNNYVDLRGRLGDASAYTSIHIAALNGNEAEVRRLLTVPEEKVHWHMALMTAITGGYERCVEMLINAVVAEGVKINENELTYAAKYAHAGIFRMIASKIVENRDVIFEKVAWECVRLDMPKNLAVLLDLGVSPNICGGPDKKLPILGFAASQLNSDCMVELLAHGAEKFESYPVEYECGIVTCKHHSDFHDLVVQIDRAGLPRSKLREYAD